MKIIVVLFALCICVGALTIKEFQVILRLGQAVCRDETGINQQIVDDVNENNINIDDENVLSYIECTMRKFSGVDKDGNFNENVIREIIKIYLDENEVNKVIMDCSSVSDDNVRIKMTKILQCLMKYKTLKEILNG